MVVLTLVLLSERCRSHALGQEAVGVFRGAQVHVARHSCRDVRVAIRGARRMLVLATSDASTDAALHFGMVSIGLALGLSLGDMGGVHSHGVCSLADTLH